MITSEEARVKAEVVECSCCGELVSIEEVNEDGLCHDCYCNMFDDEY